MTTIFTIPKTTGDSHINLIQKNALSSWKNLSSKPEIVVFGAHPCVAKNEFGTPLLSDAFAKVNKKSLSEYLVYVNADIILLSDFEKALSKAPKGPFLMVGRRWDLDISQSLDFKNSKTEKKLLEQINKKGVLHPPAGSDYFIFRKGSFATIPPFAVGRVGWDNWMIYEGRRQKIPVIDISQVATAIHQNHDYKHYKGPGKDVRSGPEAKQNLGYVGDSGMVFQLEDTNWFLDQKGLHRKRFNPRLFFKYLKHCPEVLL